MINITQVLLVSRMNEWKKDDSIIFPVNFKIFVLWKTGLFIGNILSTSI